MKRLGGGHTDGRWCLSATLLLLTILGSVKADGQIPTPSITTAADTLYRDGKFQAAHDAYLAVRKLDPANFQAAKRLGALALYSNRLDDAQSYLKQAIDLKPADPAANRLLGETYYRQDDFDQAGKFFSAAGDSAKSEKLASFRNLPPYQIQSRDQSTSLPFMNHASPETGDLPVVEVRVNGGRLAHFLIDTGGGEVVLNSAFAQESKATSFTSTQGTFAGGKQAPVLEGRIDRLTLGAFIVKNVPVQIIDLSGVHVDGVIGTVLLYHFLATIDYPGKRLILRWLSQSKQLEPPKGMAVPFRMAGDHYMIAEGTVNGRGPLLFLVDTGLNGGGFATSPAQAALITKDLKPSETGVGGGGAASAIPFTVDRLSLGDATQTNVRGLAMDGLPETALGFHLDGLISHDFFKHYAVTFDFLKMQIVLYDPKQTETMHKSGASQSPNQGRSGDDFFTASREHEPPRGITQDFLKHWSIYRDIKPPVQADENRHHRLRKHQRRVLEGRSEVRHP